MGPQTLFISHSVVLLHLVLYTTHFDWSLISGQLYIACTTVLQNIHFFAGHGADTSEDGDSVASVGGVSLMAGLNLRSLETSLRPR